MRKIVFALYLISFAGLFTARAQRNYYSALPVSEISDVGYLKPVSFIQLVEQGNKGVFNDSLSQSAQDTMLAVIEDFKDLLPIGKFVPVSEPAVNVKLQNEFERIIPQVMARQKNPQGIALPKTIDSVFTSHNIRFGLMTVTTGFTRVKGNLGKQVGKGIATGILTLGMYSQSPVKAGSTIHTIIVDTEKDIVVFYNNSSYAFEPLERKSLSKQFKSLFEKYFDLKKS